MFCFVHIDEIVRAGALGRCHTTQLDGAISFQRRSDCFR
jgi:hypothetical protein